MTRPAGDQSGAVPPEELGLERLPIYAWMAARCAGKRVLDLSSAAVRCAPWLAQAADARIIVAEADAVAALDAGLTLEGIEATAIEPGAPLPFGDGEIDVVLLLDRLSDLVASARDRLLAETKRVLAPDGIVVAGIPDPRVPMLWRRAPADGVRGDASALPSAPELQRWLGAHFAEVRLWALTPFLGFSIVGVAQTPGADTMEDEPALELTDELVDNVNEPASYHLALASDGGEESARALLVQVQYHAQVERVRATLTQSAKAAAQAKAEAAQRGEELQGTAATLRETEAEIVRWDRTSAEIADERDVLMAELPRERLRHAEELAAQAASHSLEMRQTIEQLSAERASLLADLAELEQELPRLAEAAAEVLRQREEMATLEGSLARAIARASELEAKLAEREQDEARALAESRETQRRAQETLAEEHQRSMEALRREQRQASEAMEEAHQSGLEALRREQRDGRGVVIDLEARIERLQRDVQAGVAARERVLGQYDEALMKQEELGGERARLLERVDERERELDRARERVLAADVRLREHEVRADRAETALAERDRVLAERDAALERLRAELADAEGIGARAMHRLTEVEVALGEARAGAAEAAAAAAAAGDDWSARKEAAGGRVLEELMGKLEAAEQERVRATEEVDRARVAAEEARRDAAAGKGQTQALEDEIARLARELRVERIAAETRGTQVVSLKAELDRLRAKSGG